MPRNDEHVYVIAKHVEDKIVPVTVVRGTRDDAESAASQMPSWYVLGTARLKDWR